MLVLGFKLGERVLIGDDVFVKVHAISGDTVRLAFDCPRSVPVVREKVLSRRRAADKACKPRETE